MTEVHVIGDSKVAINSMLVGGINHVLCYELSPMKETMHNLAGVPDGTLVYVHKKSIDNPAHAYGVMTGGRLK